MTRQAIPGRPRTRVGRQTRPTHGVRPHRESSNGKAIFGAIVGIIVALRSASTGVSHLVAAVNAAFDEEDQRKAWRRRGLSLCLTLAAFAFGIMAVVAIAVLPSALHRFAPTEVTRVGYGSRPEPAVTSELPV
jgi:hypothetical protein